jgi:hypothetical protein
MELKTFQNKKVSADDKIIMTEPYLLFKNGTIDNDVFVVTDYHAGRIDLISLNVYGTAELSDQILKYNGISNPFSVGEGDVLIIPPADILLIGWKKPGIDVKEANLVRDKFIETKRLPVQDQKRLEYLKRKASEKSNGAKEILPPNVLKPGQSNVVIQNGQTEVGTALSTSQIRTTAKLSSGKASPTELKAMNNINKKLDSNT